MAEDVDVVETVKAVVTEPVEDKLDALEQLSQNDDADVILAPE